MATARAWAFVVCFLWAPVSLACTPAIEVIGMSLQERAKWFYDRHAIVAHIRVERLSGPDPASGAPRRAIVHTIERFKGSPVTFVTQDLTSCGFELREKQEFIVFLASDGDTLRSTTVVHESEIDVVVPSLRRLAQQQ
jgi:hypothetical protein